MDTERNILIRSSGPSLTCIGFRLAHVPLFLHTVKVIIINYLQIHEALHTRPSGARYTTTASCGTPSPPPAPLPQRLRTSLHTQQVHQVAPHELNKYNPPPTTTTMGSQSAPKAPQLDTTAVNEHTGQAATNETPSPPCKREEHYSRLKVKKKNRTHRTPCTTTV